MALNKSDLLSGPIVRRVSPKEVCIYVALKQAAKIELSVWKGMISAKDGEIGETPIGTTSQDTVQIGKNLHMTVVRLALKEDNLLEWGKLYSYNLKFTVSDNSSTDFKALGLLDVLDDPLTKNTGFTTLGYEVDALPSFALAAPKIKDLKILHGSCRNNDNQFEDALSFVDDLIKENLADPLKRPQQLFLSGDQIYADTVIGSLLHHLTQFGNQFLDNKETLPTTWKSPGNEDRWDADITHFPAFIRKEMINSEARFTSTGSSNHLISFGEFAAMYLSVWSDVTWPKEDDVLNFEEAFHGIKEVPKNYGAIFRINQFDERTGKKEVFADALMEKTLKFLLEEIPDKALLKAILSNKGTQDQRNQAKTLLASFLEGLSSLKENDKESEREQAERFIEHLKELIGSHYLDTQEDYDKKEESFTVFKQTLPKIRRALANISTFMIFDDHEITDDWNLNPSWRDRVFTSPLGKTIIRNGMMAYALFQDWGNRADRYNREGHFFELDTELATELNTEGLTETLKTAFTEKGITLDTEKVVVKVLHTDEWLLKNQENNDEFIIRKYKKDEAGDEETLIVLGNPHAHLLGKVAELFSSDNLDVAAIEEEIDFLFGLDVQHRVTSSAGGRQQLPDNRSPLIKWSYSFEGVKHKVLVIDNRTRRSFVDFDGAPGNLSFNGMKDLIPENPEPKEDEVLFVVAPLPVLGPSVLDELIAPLLYKVYDLKAYYSEGNAVKAGMQGTDPDAIEAWAFDPESQEELLKRLAPFKKVIFLSGDVHYSSSQRLCYWTKDNEKATACFAQLTSSGLRNIMPSDIQTASQHFLNAQKMVRQNLRAERLGWHNHKINPKPIKLPEKSKPIFLNGKLKKSPVIIPVLGWPAGTETGRDPDWSWRIENVLDLRKESDRPSSTRVQRLEESDDMMDNLRKIARRHIDQAKKVNHTRQLLFKSNLGMVTFEKKENKPLLVHHDIYAVPKVGTPEEIQKIDVYTKHTIILEASNEEKAPTIPKIKAETNG